MSEAANKMSGYIASMINNMLDGKPMKVELTSITGLVSAGRKLEGKKDGWEVFCRVLLEVEDQHPELWDLLIAKLSDSSREKIKQALGKSFTRDAEKV